MGKGRYCLTIKREHVSIKINVNVNVNVNVL